MVHKEGGLIWSHVISHMRKSGLISIDLQRSQKRCNCITCSAPSKSQPIKQQQLKLTNTQKTINGKLIIPKEDKLKRTVFGVGSI